MIDFMAAHMAELGTILMAAAIIIYAITTKQWALVRSTALSLMLAAEKIMKTAEGQEKMRWVFQRSWKKLPSWAKGVITEEKLKKILQAWYEEAKAMIASDDNIE